METEVGNSLAQRLGLPRLPVGCVSVVAKPAGQAYFFLLEVAPHLRIFPYSCAVGGHKPLELYLSWPRTLWVVEVYEMRVSSVSILALKQPFAKARRDTEIFLLPLPNVSRTVSANLCLGTTFNPKQFCKAHSAADLAEGVIGYAFNSCWEGGTFGASTVLETRADLLWWHDRSKEDPDYHTKLALVTIWDGKTVKELVSRLHQRLEDLIPCSPKPGSKSSPRGSA